MTGGFQFPGRPVDEQIFAIGDVHGQATTLKKALARIREIPKTGQPRHLIFTGDIIDRGPENLRAIDLVLDAKRLASVDKVTFLPGNHELMLLNAIRNPAESMIHWATYIGIQLLDEIDPEGKIQSVDGIAGLLSDRLADFISLIDSAPNALRIGDLIFVHAGIAPGCDIDEYLACPRFQSTNGFNHWAWIDEPFLSHQGGWDSVRDITVIHGHTNHNRNRMIDPALAHDYLDLVDSNRRLCLDAGASEMGQIALLTVAGKDYALEVIQDPPFNPVYDRVLNPEIEDKSKFPASDLPLP